MAHDKKTKTPAHDPAHDAAYMRNAGGAHEHTDVNVRAVFGFLLTLTVAALFIQLLLFGMFRYLKSAYKAIDPDPNPMLSGQRLPPAQDPIRDFPQPRLQADPVHDVNKMRVAEDQALNGPPVWLDEKAGVVRIPIEQAMQLTLERGLPMTAGAAPKTMTLAPQPATPAAAAPANTTPKKTKGATKQ